MIYLINSPLYALCFNPYVVISTPWIAYFGDTFSLSVCFLAFNVREYASLVINSLSWNLISHPDLIIVRKDPDTEYVIDILEPHLPKLDDNLPKAKGFAEYAKENQSIGRIELIREGELGGQKRFVRLDLSKTAIREKVLQATTPEKLNKIFDIDGVFN